MTCGNGTRERMRSCKDSNGTAVTDSNCPPDSGGSFENETCNLHLCPGRVSYLVGTMEANIKGFHCFYLLPEWVPWGPWTSCSLSCGNGTRNRDRACQDANGTLVADAECTPATGGSNESETCNSHDCPGKVNY